MANDITTIDDRPRPPMEVMFQSLVELAKDPSVDAGKMTSLVELQMKMMDYSKQEEFNKSKIAALQEMPSITKRGEILNKERGVQSRFSKFEDINKVVKPILARHNLAISFNVNHNSQAVTVQPILSHTNGHVEKGGEMSLPLDTQGSKNGTQGAGSSTSYGKRYTMVAMLNLIEDGTDTDGYETILIDEGAAAASCGTEAYERWFKDQKREDKIKLHASGKHDQYKADAKEADKERE